MENPLKAIRRYFQERSEREHRALIVDTIARAANARIIDVAKESGAFNADEPINLSLALESLFLVMPWEISRDLASHKITREEIIDRACELFDEMAMARAESEIEN